MKSWWVAAVGAALAGCIVVLVVQLKLHPTWASPVETGAATAAALFTALAAFGSYRSAQLSASAAKEARSALALHHRPFFGVNLKTWDDAALELEVICHGAKDVTASWTDKTGATHSASLPDSGGKLVLPTVRIVEFANAEVGKVYTTIDAQRVMFHFRDQATDSRWEVALPKYEGSGGNLVVDSPLPALAR